MNVWLVIKKSVEKFEFRREIRVVNSAEMVENLQRNEFQLNANNLLKASICSYIFTFQYVHVKRLLKKNELVY